MVEYDIVKSCFDGKWESLTQNPKQEIYAHCPALKELSGCFGRFKDMRESVYLYDYNLLVSYSMSITYGNGDMVFKGEVNGGDKYVLFFL